MNSFWTIFFLQGSNKHDYFLVAHFFTNGVASPPTSSLRVSLLDITDKYYFGATYSTPNATYNAEAFRFHDDKFESYSTSPDLFSTQVVKSNVKGAEFHLESAARGPNLYGSGNGLFFWGTDWTYELAYPEQWVTGNLTYKGEVIDIVSEKSMSWLDRQYGPGLGEAGWYLWILYLDNGAKMTIWHSESVKGGPVQYFTTVLFPDGHHEVYPIDGELRLEQPFISAQTGLTYYALSYVRIPGLDAVLRFHQPVAAGEMAQEHQPAAATTLYEGYVDVQGTFQGQNICGWGVAERKHPII